MTINKINKHEEFDLADLVKYGSKDRKNIRPKVLVGIKTKDNYESGLIFDANETIDQTSKLYLPIDTKYGAKIGISLNPDTYVLTAQLYDANNDPLGDSSSVDLPIESLVISGRYDAETKTLILVLESGDEIDIPVADLISGLQEEITEDNKLSSDLVDDTGNTNLFVTSEDKSTWSGKQDAITSSNMLSSDLVDDSNNTHKFATAAQLTAIDNMAWYEGE